MALIPDTLTKTGNKATFLSCSSSYARSSSHPRSSSHALRGNSAQTLQRPKVKLNIKQVSTSSIPEQSRIDNLAKIQINRSRQRDSTESLTSFTKDILSILAFTIIFFLGESLYLCDSVVKKFYCWHSRCDIRLKKNLFIAKAISSNRKRRPEFSELAGLWIVRCKRQNFVHYDNLVRVQGQALRTFGVSLIYDFRISILELNRIRKSKIEIDIFLILWYINRKINHN